MAKQRGDRAFGTPLWVGSRELTKLLEGITMGETMWKCDQVRAGQLYTSMMFDSKEEAEAFASKMQQAVPDQVFHVEPIEASAIWN
jgi:hypothetical protein